MAKLRDAAQAIDEIKGTLDELKRELGDGGGDFDKLVQLSDQISERADSLAETFGDMNEVLMNRIGNAGRSGGRTSNSGNSSSGRSQSRQKSGSRS